MNEEWQRVLIHRVDEGHILDTEEKTSSCHGNGLVSNASLIDFNFSLLCDGLLLVDVIRDNLRVLKNFNSGSISKNIIRVL